MPQVLRFMLLPIVCTAVVLFSNRSVQAEPEVRAVSIRGFQIEGTTTIRIDGTGLLPKPQLILSVPIAKQVVKPGATATRVEFDVTLDSRVEPGIYNLWLTSAEGVSLPTVVAADRLPQVPFATKIETLPVALHGAVSGSSRLRTSFTATAGQPLLIEAEAQRLGGKLRPVLHIYDNNNQQLAWTLPSPTLRGDSRLKFTPPSDGTFTVELHDLQYAAPAPNFFRLKIGDWQYADLVFPPAVQSGTKTNLILLGGNADGETVAFEARSTANGRVASSPWKDPVTATGLRPPVLISDFPELVETTPAEAPQKLTAIPSAVSGRFLAPGELDKYQIEVQPGDKLRFEVFADRLGSPVDSTLELQNEKGGRLVVNDDANGSPDSRLDYTVPANVKTLFVVVKDANGRSGPHCIYRVVATRLPGSGGQPDFRLRLEQQRQSVAAGNRLVVKVIANREGFDGPIHLSFDSLPAGIQVQGATIGAGSGATLLTLHGAGSGLTHSLTKLRGVAKINGRKVERIAAFDGHVLGRLQPWLTGELGLAVARPSATGFRTDWGSIDLDTHLVLGGKLDLPVSAVRPAGFDGPVRMVLETSQPAVRAANNQVDTNRTIRSETNKPIEIAIDANAQKSWDAKMAADKIVSDSKANQTTIAETGRKAKTAADIAAKTAIARQTAMKEAAAKATATAKAAGDADAIAQKAVTEAAIQTKAAALAADQADAPKVAEAAKVAVAAAALAKTAAEKKAATSKALATAAAAAKKATDDLSAADKAVTAATAAVKAANDAAVKADAAAVAKLKDAETKLQAAVTAARTAATLAKNEGTFSIFVPANLTEDGYEIALRAELLSRDKKSVLDSTHTTVRRFNTMIPIVVALSGSDSFAGEIDPKAGSTITITGKVERLAGMSQDVTVTLSGLPGGITVPKTVVKPDQSDFKLNVVFPAAFKPAKLKSVRLFATGKMRANAPIDVRSKEIPLTISLKAKAEPVKTP